MHIAGFKESSLNEWEGYVTSIVWTAGCNWRCAYCHGRHLILEPDEIDRIEEEIIFDFIKGKEGWIDGLCISGGEPTIQPDLIDFIERAKKELGVAIKLETNGSNPEVIKEILKKGLLTCLCLDLKTLPKDVLRINGQTGGVHDILESYNAAFKADIDVEFHTTLCPEFVRFEHIKSMAEFLHNKGLWVLQQYNYEEALIPEKAGDKTYSESEAKEIHEEAKKYHNNVILKNI